MGARAMGISKSERLPDGPPPPDVPGVISLDPAFVELDQIGDA